MASVASTFEQWIQELLTKAKESDEWKEKAKAAERERDSLLKTNEALAIERNRWKDVADELQARLDRIINT